MNKYCYKSSQVIIRYLSVFISTSIYLPLLHAQVTIINE